MPRLYVSFFLLLTAGPAWSVPLVICEPEHFLSRWGVSLLVGGYLSAVAAVFLYALNDEITWKVVTVTGLILALALAAGLFPLTQPLTYVAVLNKDALYAAAEVQQGLHYRDECVRVGEDESTLELLCNSDVVRSVVARENYSRAIEALSAADKRREDLELQLENTRLCSDHPVLSIN